MPTTPSRTWTPSTTPWPTAMTWTVWSLSAHQVDSGTSLGTSSSSTTATSYPNLYRKLEVPFSGPLFNGVVVHRDELAALVRATAINASKAKRLYMSAYKHFVEERFDCISSLASRHRERNTFEEYATEVHALRDDLISTCDGSKSDNTNTIIEGFLASTLSLLERSSHLLSQLNADSLTTPSTTNTHFMYTN